MSASATARNLLAPVVRWGYRLRVQGAHHCPRRGPLLVVAPRLGFLDPTVISTCLPRPVEVLVDPGAVSALGARVPGRIVVEPQDPGVALRSALGLLRAGSAVGAWTGEGHERAAGYLAVRSGAAILPVAVLGGGGRNPGDPPGWRTEIDLVVGEPFVLPGAPGPDPATRAAVLHAAEVIRQRVADHAVHSGMRAGRRDGVALDGPGTAPDNGGS